MENNKPNEGEVIDPDDFIDQKMQFKKNILKINEYEKQKMNYLKDKKG